MCTVRRRGKQEVALHHPERRGIEHVLVPRLQEQFTVQFAINSKNESVRAQRDINRRDHELRYRVEGLHVVKEISLPGPRVAEAREHRDLVVHHGGIKRRSSLHVIRKIKPDRLPSRVRGHDIGLDRVTGTGVLELHPDGFTRGGSVYAHHDLGMIRGHETHLVSGIWVPHRHTSPLDCALGFDYPNRVVAVRRGGHGSLRNDAAVGPKWGDLEPVDLVGHERELKRVERARGILIDYIVAVTEIHIIQVDRVGRDRGR